MKIKSKHGAAYRAGYVNGYANESDSCPHSRWFSPARWSAWWAGFNKGYRRLIKQREGRSYE